MDTRTCNRLAGLPASALLLSISVFAFAGTHSISVSVGGTSIHLPAPSGFQEVSQSSPAMRELAETLTPSTNRPLAVFASESDVDRIAKGQPPELRRYMMVQVQRQIEQQTVSPSQFAQLASVVKQKQEEVLAASKDKVSALLENASGKLSKSAGIALKLKVGEQIPMGIYLDTPSALGFASLVRYELSTAGKKSSYVVAAGMNIVNAAYKPVFAYVYAEYEGQSDLQWVRETSATWTNQIAQANPVKNASFTGGHGDRGGIDWSQVTEKALVGAIIGGLLGLVGWLIQKARKRTIKEKD